MKTPTDRRRSHAGLLTVHLCRSDAVYRGFSLQALMSGVSQ
jgi:hypothetical protein